jgi:hypothetical protein
MNEEKLSLNDLAIAALRESAKWCMFLSIVGFIFIGLMVIGGLFMTVAMSAISSMPNDPYSQMGASNPFMAIKGFIGLIYILFALLYFFPIYYLFNYAKGTKQALESGNGEVLSKALVNLKSHHKFLGIMTIVIISLYIIGIIAVVAFAASFAGGM